MCGRCISLIEAEKQNLEDELNKLKNQVSDLKKQLQNDNNSNNVSNNNNNNGNNTQDDYKDNSDNDQNDQIDENNKQQDDKQVFTNEDGIRYTKQTKKVTPPKINEIDEVDQQLIDQLQQQDEEQLLEGGKETAGGDGELPPVEQPLSVQDILNEANTE